MNNEEKKLDDLMNELGEVLNKVRGNLNGILTINNHMIEITRTWDVDDNNRTVRNTELRLKNMRKD